MIAGLRDEGLRRASTHATRLFYRNGARGLHNVRSLPDSVAVPAVAVDWEHLGAMHSSPTGTTGTSRLYITSCSDREQAVAHAAAVQEHVRYHYDVSIARHLFLACRAVRGENSLQFWATDLSAEPEADKVPPLMASQVVPPDALLRSQDINMPDIRDQGRWGELEVACLLDRFSSAFPEFFSDQDSLDERIELSTERGPRHCTFQVRSTRDPTALRKTFSKLYAEQERWVKEGFWTTLLLWTWVPRESTWCLVWFPLLRQLIEDRGISYPRRGRIIRGPDDTSGFDELATYLRALVLLPRGSLGYRWGKTDRASLKRRLSASLFVVGDVARICIESLADEREAGELIRELEGTPPDEDKVRAILQRSCLGQVLDEADRDRLLSLCLWNRRRPRFSHAISHRLLDIVLPAESDKLSLWPLRHERGTQEALASSLKVLADLGLSVGQLLYDRLSVDDVITESDAARALNLAWQLREYAVLGLPLGDVLGRAQKCIDRFEDFLRRLRIKELDAGVIWLALNQLKDLYLRLLGDQFRAGQCSAATVENYLEGRNKDIEAGGNLIIEDTVLFFSSTTIGYSEPQTKTDVRRLVEHFDRRIQVWRGSHTRLPVTEFNLKLDIATKNYLECRARSL